MISKNRRIEESTRNTVYKRREQYQRVYELKLDESSLSITNRLLLDKLFNEAKEFYNYLVNIAKRDGKHALKHINPAKVMVIKLRDGEGNWVDKTFEVLKSAQRTEIHKHLCSTIYKIECKGLGLNDLHFRKTYNNIPLRQYFMTHRILFPNRLKIQGMDGSFRVSGLKQFRNISDIEFGVANLIRRSSGYYIKVATFKNGAFSIDPEPINETIAINFGKNGIITLSDGRVFDFSADTRRLKYLQKKLTRQKEGSNNYKKTKQLIEACLEDIHNKQFDDVNKFIAMIKKYKRIAIKEEVLEGDPLINKIRTKISKIDQVVLLDNVVPITQWCRKCGCKITEEGEEFKCPRCGLTEPNNIHAVKNMKFILDKFIPVGCREFNYVEFGNFLRRGVSNWEA